ncbi:MAG: SDR family oxidoreductase [Antricoccus sp.]
MTTETKTVIITGAGSGIGRACAIGFAEAGFNVALCGRRRERLDETAALLSGPSLVLPLDVTDAEAVNSAFEAVAHAYGRIDVLFNNAGTFGPSYDIDEIPVAEWTATVAVNLTGSMLCAAAAVRQMRKQQPQGGRIINNGSISAHTPRPKSAAYTATKHAITGLTKSIDLDGRAYGVSAGQIDIGNAATDLISAIAAGAGAAQADGSRKIEPSFDVNEVSKAVVMMATLPPSATINSMVISATGMPFVGRG